MADAVVCEAGGDLKAARAWAIKSLRYSIGILHPDYTRAIK